MTTFSGTGNLQAIRDIHPRYIFLLEILSEQYSDFFVVVVVAEVFTEHEI